MKHFFTIIFLLFSFFCTAQRIKFKSNWGYDASDNSFAKKRFYISAGYGFPNLLKKNFIAFEQFGNYSFKSIGPLNAKLEYSINDKIGVLVGYSFSNCHANWGEKYTDSGSSQTLIFEKGFDIKSNVFYVGANTHGFTNAHIDIYFGANIGYRTVTISPFDENIFTQHLPKSPKIDPLVYFGYIGLRAFVAPKVAAFFEAGYSNQNNVNAGLLYRIGL